MNNRNKDQEPNIIALETLLEELKIEQNNINHKIDRANKQIAKIKEKQNETNKQNNYIADTNIEIGDKVKIKNPNWNQQNKGIAESLTKTGYVRVKTDNGNIVRRWPTKLAKITQHTKMSTTNDTNTTMSTNTNNRTS